MRAVLRLGVALGDGLLTRRLLTTEADAIDLPDYIHLETDRGSRGQREVAVDVAGIGDAPAASRHRCRVVAEEGTYRAVSVRGVSLW